ncbi:MAG: hypothetical protein R3D68_17200 [Hyphomicrobiaceae bacterium]
MFDKAKVELEMLMRQLAERPHDRQELEFTLREKLAAIRAAGMPLPDDLAALVDALDSQLVREEHQRARDAHKQG